jgi:hypothetical protein
MLSLEAIIALLAFLSSILLMLLLLLLMVPTLSQCVDVPTTELVTGTGEATQEAGGFAGVLGLDFSPARKVATSFTSSWSWQDAGDATRCLLAQSFLSADLSLRLLVMGSFLNRFFDSVRSMKAS